MSDVFVRLHGQSSTPLALESLPPIVARRLAEAQITNEHLAGLLAWLGAGPVVVALTAVIMGIVPAAIAAAVLGVTPVVFVGARSGRRSRQLIAQLPEMIDMLARSLRSGASLRGALVEVTANAPRVIADELWPILRALERGRSTAAALDDWVLRSPLPEVRAVAAALSLAAEHQSGTTQALEGVGQTLRDRRRLNREIRALTAQASVSMQALVLLPIGFLALDMAASQHVVRYLIADGFGRVCLGVGAVLNLAGWLWMRLLIKRRLPS